MYSVFKAFCVGVPFVAGSFGAIVGLSYLMVHYPLVAISVVGGFAIAGLSIVLGSIIIGED